MSIDTNKFIAYWLKNSELKWQTAKSLKQAGRYADCLFFCHLSLECLLKGLVCRATGEEAPYIHNLARLAAIAKLELSAKQSSLLKIVSLFNIRTRYADYKMTFYKKAGKAYTSKYFKECNIIRLWLLKKLQEK